MRHHKPLTVLRCGNNGARIAIDPQQLQSVVELSETSPWQTSERQESLSYRSVMVHARQSQMISKSLYDWPTSTDTMLSGWLEYERAKNDPGRTLPDMNQFDKDMTFDHRDLFIKVRDLLLSTDGVEETKKPRITTYANKAGGICHVRTMSYGVDIGFLKGAKMEDRPGRLTGTGKAMRVLPLQTFDMVTTNYYLKQAMALNG